MKARHDHPTWSKNPHIASLYSMVEVRTAPSNGVRLITGYLTHCVLYNSLKRGQIRCAYLHRAFTKGTVILNKFRLKSRVHRHDGISLRRVQDKGNLHNVVYPNDNNLELRSD